MQNVLVAYDLLGAKVVVFFVVVTLQEQCAERQKMVSVVHLSQTKALPESCSFAHILNFYLFV